MAAITDSSGRYLIDDTGAHVGTVHSDACADRVAALCLGTVFVSGIGDGAILARLNDLADVGDVVVIARPQEASMDLIDNYVAEFPLDPPVDNIEVLEALELQIHPPGPPYDPHYDWTMGVFDLTVKDLSTDSTFLSKINTLWPNITGRIVVLSESPELTLTGWTALAPTLIDGTYVYIFDRFDPDNSIGEAEPFGRVYDPGFGWQA